MEENLSNQMPTSIGMVGKKSVTVLKDTSCSGVIVKRELVAEGQLQARSVSQTLFGNPKGPIELGNPNTYAKTKLCQILFYSDSRNSPAMSLMFLYSWFKRNLGLVR